MFLLTNWCVIEWQNCTKVIIQWEETIDILDFLEIDDKIYEEEEDDQPL